MLPSRRDRHQAGRAQHREVLAHVRDLAADPRREVAHGELAGREGLQHAQALGVRERATDGGEPHAIRVARDRGRCRHPQDSVTPCASTQVPASDPPAGRPRTGPLRYCRRCPTTSSASTRSSPPARSSPATSTGRRCCRRRRAARILAGAGGPDVADGTDLPQGRAPPEDRLVQAARDDEQGRVAHGRRSGRAGSITLSAGNAAQAYAWAGREAGVHATVVMPAEAVRSKVDACLGYGAEVVLHGAHVGETLRAGARARGRARPGLLPPVRRPGGHRRPRDVRASRSSTTCRMSTSSSSASAAAG